jgi:SagB-type dehydrogenase family enzyme
VTGVRVSTPVLTYHDGTKHHFHRFARSLGYLDWASQPNPFRSFAGAPAVPLHPRPDTNPQPGLREPQAALSSSKGAILDPQSAVRLSQSATIGDVLRHALGLSAWKQFGASRWSLRVNPSSGNLHPTEAYVIAGASAGLGDTAGVYHYAPDRHALERRCAFDAAAWEAAVADGESWLIALTSIHWREAWKYGERAFRYCQHDMGHAIAALRIAAAMAGLAATLVPDWPHADIAGLTGVDRDDDYVEAEREEPGCLIWISRQSSVGSLQSSVGEHRSAVGREQVLTAVRDGRWTGKASQLSEDHTTWSFIDEIAAATRDPGRDFPARRAHPADPAPPAYPARVILQRRSAVAFDGVSSIGRETFLAMLSSVMPRPAAPWDALWWEARIHLAIFVHRVDAVAPGLYLLVRHESALERLRVACGREFLWERASDTLPLYLLARGDARAIARRLSCDQDIASDGFFSLGMIADFDASLDAHGASFYRNLFWESGAVGQVLYLEAEAAGVRSTGIGCFYDDPVHDVLGLQGHAFQSLYHFTVGMPVEDTRLTTEPGYGWEG